MKKIFAVLVSLASVMLPQCLNVAIAQPPITAPKPPFPRLSPAELETLAGPPTLVTLHLGDVPLRTALDELGKQANLEISAVTRENQEPVSIDVDAVPFWRALAIITAQANLYVSEYSAGIFRPVRRDAKNMGRLFLQSATVKEKDKIRLPEAIHPYVSVVCGGATATRSQSAAYNSLLLRSGTDSAYLILRFAALLDPKLINVPVNMEVRWESLKDVRGRSLEFNQTQTPITRLQGLVRSFTATAPLPAVDKIASAKGVLSLTMALKSEVWEVPNILEVKDVQKTFKLDKETATVKIESVTGANRNYRMRVTGELIQRGAAPDPPALGLPRLGTMNSFNSFSYSTWMDKAQLLDADGNVYQRSGNSYNRSANTLEATLNFTAPFVVPGDEPVGPPSRFILEVPTEPRLLEIPFEIKDLTIPAIP